MDNATRVRNFIARVWNERDYDRAGDLYGPTFQTASAPGLRGPEAKIGHIKAFHTAFDDLQVHLEELVAEGDTVAYRMRATGTQTGPFAGRPANGQPMTTWSVSFLRFAGERVTSEWIGADYLGIFIAIGALESPWPR